MSRNGVSSGSAADDGGGGGGGGGGGDAESSSSSNSATYSSLPPSPTLPRQLPLDDDDVDDGAGFIEYGSDSEGIRAAASDAAARAVEVFDDDDDDDDEDDNATDAELHRSIPLNTTTSSSGGSRVRRAKPVVTAAGAGAGGVASATAPPKRKYVFEVKQTSFVPRFMLSKAANNADGIMPKSTPGLLHRLSLDDLSDVPLERSVHLRAVVRECELIAGRNQLRTPSNVKDLRRLLRVYDDYAMRRRPTRADEEERFDKMHQYALFIARMKIINVLENCPAASAPAITERADWRDLYIENHYYVEAECISDVDLALWLLEKNACHPDMLVVDRRSNAPAHRLQSCSLECFWQSLLSLMATWPTLPMSGYVVRVFNEMRRRAAFFLSYREFASLDAKHRFDESERKVLGLHASLFDLVNFDASAAAANAGGGGGGGGDGGGANIDLSVGLLDNFNFSTIGDDGYVAVNTEFVDQCEMIFHHMQVQLRKACGLARSPLDSTLAIDNLRGDAGAADDTKVACVMCRRRTRAALTPAHIERFEELVAQEMSGGFRLAITEEFRGSVMAFLLQPSEMAEFAAMHAREVQTPLNCISRQRQADFRKLSEALLVPQCTEVWRALRGAHEHPAYAVMAALAINFHLQQHFKGTQFVNYYLQAEEELRPFAHMQERMADRRNVYGELHTPRVTTGTLRYRNKLVQEAGVNAAPLESDYQHPLVLRTMNSHDVVYREHTHRVRSFAHAFLHWLELMCTDRHIRGQSSTGGNALLYPLYATLFPERAGEAHALERATRAKLRAYNPIVRLIGDADLDDNTDGDDDDDDDDDDNNRRNKRVRPAIYNKMSQF